MKQALRPLQKSPSRVTRPTIPADFSHKRCRPRDLTRRERVFCRGLGLLLIPLVALVWISFVSLAEDASNVSQTVSLQTFKIVTERNIFDYNRHAGSSSGFVRKIDPSRLARANGFSVVGTLVLENGVFAFFDGTDPQFRKALNVGGTIADYRVVEITPTGVKLEANGKQVQLPVGMQMKRIDATTWQMVAAADSSSKSPADQEAASETKPSGSSGESAGTDAGANTVLKKLMEQRERQLR